MALRTVGAAAAVLLLLTACGDGRSTPPTETSSQAVPTQQPDAAGLVCAAGSTEQFRAAQSQAPFAIYCPTHLPAGYALERVFFGPDEKSNATPTAANSSLWASFANDTTGGRIVFDQGPLGDDVFPEWRFHTPPPMEPTTYGDFTVTLYVDRTYPDGARDSAVLWGDSPDGHRHLVFCPCGTVDTATMRDIGEGMRRLGPVGTPVSQTQMPSQ